MEVGKQLQDEGQTSLVLVISNFGESVMGISADYTFPIQFFMCHLDGGLNVRMKVLSPVQIRAMAQSP